MNRNKVLLVDQNDTIIGEMEKLSAHEQGKLHRAFSVFIFNNKGELLLQQRASHKYHGADLWTNTCCSHPQPGEETLLSAKERLDYEMGMDCELTWLYSFLYHAQVENKLTEHELDHVFVGYADQDPTINPDEVRDYKWLPVSDILSDIKRNPSHYTVWFKESLPEVISKIKSKILVNTDLSS